MGGYTGRMLPEAWFPTSGDHRILAFGAFLLALALLTSLPSTSRCRSVCPPHATSQAAYGPTGAE